MIPFARDNPIFGKMIVENCPLVVEASGIEFIGTDKDYSEIPDCSDTFFVSTNTDQGKGCCKMTSPDQTCKGLTNDDYHNMGLKILNPENNNLNEICFSNPFLKKLPKIDNFVELVTVSVLTLISSMFIGVCLEFWLRYGESKDCIYYKSKCNNIGKTNEISLVEYIFPDNICYYPYQECSKSNSDMQGGGLKVKNNVGKMKGGGDIISNMAGFRNQGAKCVTIDDKIKETNTKPFPYNIADFAEKNIESDFLKMPFKSFSFFFLFTILGIRIVFNAIFKKLSKFYQENVRGNAILSNIIFLLITGLIFPILSFYLGMPNLKYGTTYILIGLFMILSLAFSFSFLASYVIIIAEGLPEKYNILKKFLIDCNIDTRYYNIFKVSNDFIDLVPKLDPSDNSGVWETIKRWLKIIILFLLRLLVNLIILTFIIVIGVFSLLFISVVAAVIVIIYMNMSLLFNIFYIPLSNFPEMLEIIKSHGSLLTVLFCFSIIFASKSTLNDTTTAIMSGILGIIVIYKLITNIKKK